MFTSLGAFIYARRWLTLGASALFLLIAVAVALRGARLTVGTFGNNEAERADALVAEVLGSPTENTFVAIFHSDTLDPRDAAFQEAMEHALDRLRRASGVLSAMGPNDAPPPLAVQMVSGAKKSAAAMIALKGDFKDALAAYPRIRSTLESPELAVTCTGYLPFMSDFNHVLEHDLVLAELLSLPLSLLVMLFVFRTGVAAALPVAVGALAVLGGIAIVFALSRVVDVAGYTVNICSLIGLGVAIDYSLFTVSRYREELAAGYPYADALSRALDGAGRVVCFSGFTLVVGLGGLLFFHGSFVAMMGIGGMFVALLAVVFALTLLPALLAVLGPRIDALRLWHRTPRPDSSFWRRTAAHIMKTPLRFLVPAAAVLVVMGLPFEGISLTAADVRVLHRGVEARDGYEALKRDFPELAATRIVVAIRFPTAPALDVARIGALYDLGQRLARTPHVTHVESIFNAEGMGKEDLESVLLHPPELTKTQIEAGEKMTVSGRVVLLYALVDAPPESSMAKEVVRAVRSRREVLDGSLLVGGSTASDMDATEFILSRTPHAVAFVVGATFVILFVLLGSVLLPLKAIVMNALSVTASFGALVWIFQEGHLGIAEPRPIDHLLPILLFCVLFGISMDYEVLMLTRIKEAWERTGDNDAAVAEGLEKTGGLITSAAAIMVVVFGAFATASVVEIRAMGFGMALAVAVDATLVRIVLVPATMKLFGHLNWWEPSFLRRLRGPLR